MKALLWTFPGIMAASVIIGWAAEVCALHISAGIALAILAFLQTLPEFGVEAFIAWHGDTSLMLANLTGSLRLFVGLGWPMVMLIHFFSSRKKRTQTSFFNFTLHLPRSFSVEATFLFIPILVFSLIDKKGIYTLKDGVVLCLLYFVYLSLLELDRRHHKSKPVELHPSEANEELEYIPAQIARLPHKAQLVLLLILFSLGGTILYICVHPFVESLKSVAVAAGMSEFVFIQWIAPFASEFPEKITAFNWARRASKVPMAIFNMVSSSVNQWTLLAGFVPLIYSLSLKAPAEILLTPFQKTELQLTLVQSFLGALFLSDLEFKMYEALGLLTLWIIQFLVPSTREEIFYVYTLWIGLEILKFCIQRKIPQAWKDFLSLLRWAFKI